MALITPNPSIGLLQDYLSTRGYTWTKFSLGQREYCHFVAPNGKSWLTQAAFICYPFVSASAVKISRRKDLAYEFCEHVGVRAPRTRNVTAVTPPEELEALLKEGQVVVKPHDSSLSRGVTLHITTMPKLQRALKAAFEYSDTALVQEQVEGEEIRFVVLSGKAKAAILRRTPRLVGNGKDSVAELLAAENDDRRALSFRYITYPELTDAIVDLSNVDMDRIPAEGEVVELSRSTMIRTGASVYNVLSEVDGSYIAIAEKLASALGADFVVVDMMLEDYTAQATGKNYAFIEFNTAPVLKLFYSCRDGRHYDVLSDLGPMIESHLQGVAHE